MALEIQASFEYNVPIPSVKNCQNVVSNSADVVPQNDNYAMIETYVTSISFASKIPFPLVENRNSFNSDFNIVTQNNKQHLCLDVIPCRKKRPMEYIWTFNGSAKITLKVPQTLASLTITHFITYSYCVLCRTSSKDSITNKNLKKLRHKKK